MNGLAFVLGYIAAAVVIMVVCCNCLVCGRPRNTGNSDPSSLQDGMAASNASFAILVVADNGGGASNDGSGGGFGGDGGGGGCGGDGGGGSGGDGGGGGGGGDGGGGGC